MKVDLLRPLAAQAFALLPAGNGKFVFPGVNGGASISNIAQRVEQLQKASGTSGWTMHDLRRTAGTLMSRAGADSDIAERCLGHIIGGVRGVYDRREYAKEKQRPIRRSRAWSTASWSRRPRT